MARLPDLIEIAKKFDFKIISIKDLIEARDTFYAHLINKRNVVATAIGRYLIWKGILIKMAITSHNIRAPVEHYIIVVSLRFPGPVFWSL